MLCRNCLLEHVFDGKVEGRLVYVKEKRGYWKLKENALCGELDLEEAVDLSLGQSAR
jgi:hypothetical protein